eukprot:XP_001695050.1 predicted protein [Chlamydomonas reinhardtii]
MWRCAFGAFSCVSRCCGCVALVCWRIIGNATGYIWIRAVKACGRRRVWSPGWLRRKLPGAAWLRSTASRVRERRCWTPMVAATQATAARSIPQRPRHRAKSWVSLSTGARRPAAAATGASRKISGYITQAWPLPAPTQTLAVIATCASRAVTTQQPHVLMAFEPTSNAWRCPGELEVQWCTRPKTVVSRATQNVTDP